MKLTVLIDNNTYIDKYYFGEPALSFYIEDNDSKLLFDVGYSGMFMKNAHDLNIDLDSVTDIAISHGHNDHTGGLFYLARENKIANKNIIAHPNAFQKKYLDGDEIGSLLSLEQLQKLCKLTLSKEPIRISQNIMFLGEIPVYNDFEIRDTIGTVCSEGAEQPDYLIEDTALVYHSSRGLFIITGCSHNGICNIIEHAKKVCNEERIIGVIGGFHLFEVSNQLKMTIEYFMNNNITKLYPCHCVSFKAKAEIHKFIPLEEVGVGLTIEI